MPIAASSAHPLVPTVAKRGPSSSGSSSKELLSTPVNVALESVFLLSAMAFVPVLALCVLVLGGFKSAASWARTGQLRL